MTEAEEAVPVPPAAVRLRTVLPTKFGRALLVNIPMSCAVVEVELFVRRTRAAEPPQVRRDGAQPGRHAGELRQPLIGAQGKRMQQHDRPAAAGLEVANRSVRQMRDLREHGPIVTGDAVKWHA